MNNKSGQTTSEFLMTYGWVIIVLIVTTGSLFYFKVFSIDRIFPDKCFISAGISCLDFSVESSRVILSLKNTHGETLTIHEVKVLSDGGLCSEKQEATLENNDRNVFTIPSCNNGNVGQKFKGGIKISYTLEGKLTHSIDGTLFANIVAGSAVSSQEICLNSEISGQCSNLNSIYGWNYKYMCCKEHNICCLEERLDAYLSAIQEEMKTARSAANNLQDPKALQDIISEMSAGISVEEYNSTLETLKVRESLSSAVNAIEVLVEEILNVKTSSYEDNATKIASINTKFNQIKDLRNTTVVSVAITHLESKLSVDLADSITGSVIDELSASAGLSEADKAVFKQESEMLQSKTTVKGKAQSLLLTFLNGRTANATLFEKEVNISGIQEGEFYVNEFIDKNITGGNDLNASIDLTNRIATPITIVAEDPIIRWSFGSTQSATVKYTIDKNVPSGKINSTKTVVTAVPRQRTAYA